MILSGPFLKTETWIEDAERLIRSLPDGDAMWKHVEESVTKGVFDEEYKRIDDLYQKNFYSRVPGAMEGTPEEPEKRIVDGVDVYNYMWGPSDFVCTGILRGCDVTPYLKEIQIPILYLCGEYDNGSPEASAYYNSMTPNGEVCVLPDCAHDLTRERPEEFNAAVESFIGKLKAWQKYLRVMKP